jgi:hypothetical protein
MPRVQDAIPSLDCRAWKGRSNPLLLSTLRFTPETRLDQKECQRRTQGQDEEKFPNPCRPCENSS